MRTMRLVTLALVACVSTSGCSGDTAGPIEIPQAAIQLEAEDVVTLQTVWSGHDVAARRVINSQAEWADAWSRIYIGMSPTPTPPAVDFGSSSIVLAAMGQRPTGGYRIDITEVRLHAGALYVRLLEQSPGVTCGTYNALTAPVHAVQIPKHVGPSYFIVQKQTIQC